jgi:predicted heme/steroid binding protein
MEPEINLTKAELSLYNGEEIDQMFIAYRGIVYDVTDCPKWRRGIHEGLHFPGQELTKELSQQAPHGNEVFLHPCVKVVGRLQESRTR